MEWTRGHTLGHGSTATVSLGRSIRSGEIFAVKSVELSGSKWLRREQRILSSICCPYIIGYRGCDTTIENDKVMYNIFLEYEPGGTLYDAIRANGGRLQESVIGYYTWQILQGIDYVHSRGIVHCDIKTSNILVGPRGAKVADFGCSKQADMESVSHGQVGGTPMFMAPEVARGENQCCASDIWALGCMVIEMSSGSAPWPNCSNDPFSVMQHVAHSGRVPEFPVCLSEDAKDFLDKCLRIDPKERWAASQLLKHPFLIKSQATNVNKLEGPKTYSPTSIIDQGVWNSLVDDDEDQPSQAMERIRCLAKVSGEPALSFNEDLHWITIRERAGSVDKYGCGGS